MQAQLVALLACLHCETRIIRSESTEQDAVKELARNVAKIIAPVVTTAERGYGQSEGVGACLGCSAPFQYRGTLLTIFIVPSREAIIKQCQATSSMGVEALEALMKQVGPVRLEDEVLFALLVYTDKTTTWGSPQTKASAAKLLEQQLNTPGSLGKDQFIAESILQNYLRPLFSKSKPSSITASGRKAEYHDTAATRGEGIPDDSALTKPWKFTDLRAIPAMKWAVREADVSID